MPTAPVLPANEKTGSVDWAVRQAQAALDEQRFDIALTWLHRAARLLPEDPTVQLMLASAQAHADPAAAIGILQALVARRPDDRDAALALTATLLRAGRAADAAACLHGMLGRMTPPDTELFRTVAGGVCQGAGAQGWMWLDGNGTCFVRLTADAPAATIGLELDEAALGSVQVRPGRQAAVVLPEGWRGARRLDATPARVRLLGSGLSPAWFGRVEGYVAVAGGGIVQGWARLPADPDTRPAVYSRRTDGSLHALAVDQAPDRRAEGQATRWRFAVPAGALAGEAQAQVVDAVGRSLWGSPILLGGEQDAARRAAQSLALQSLPEPHAGHASSADPFRPLPTALLPAAPRSGPRLGRVACDVIVPVHGGAAELEVCLASLTAFLPRTSQLVLVNDGSPDPAIAARLRSVAGERVTVLEHAQARGFPAAVNAGLAHLRPAPGRDVVILNADTAVSRHWLARLSAVAHSDPAIGSCTPLTNDGTIVSYPTPGEPGDAPGPVALAAINRLCWEANGSASVPIPTGVGFCMLMKGACIAETGFFREDAFAQGYGEENDWCLRAAHLGWRHAAAPGVFVAHSGGRSFGGAKTLLMDRNAAVLERLHPGYGDYVTAAIAAEPLLAARRRIDRLALLQSPGTVAVALVTHDAGGGVARHVAHRCAEIAASGRRPIVLSPQEDTPGLCHLTLGAGKDARRLPNLRFTLPEELDALAAVLRDAGVAAVEIHHLLNHDPSVSTLPALLGVPYGVTVHDYGHWCPRFSLTSRGNRYCGEPLAVAECEECIADLGSRYPDGVTVRDLRERSARLLGGARRVTVACEDVAARIHRQFPSVTPVIEAWEGPIAPAPKPPVRDASEIHVVVVGAIGIEKGYDVLLGCARDAVRRGLKLRFTVVGFTIDDSRLMATGRVFVTGPFTEGEALALVQAQDGVIGFVPSVCPETWCFALSTLWRSGLSVLGFALGAQGDRIGRSGRGWLLPLGLSPAKINDALVSRGLEIVQVPSLFSSRQAINERYAV